MIPDLTLELQLRIEQNTEYLIQLGAKEWMKKRRKKNIAMSEVEQKEQVRKIEEKIFE